MQPRFSYVTVNGIRLHVAEAGPADGPLAILLHGFPEFWFGWRGQIGPLAEAGYHVVAPDQRGYNLSDKPRGVMAYHLDRLAGDILALGEHFGHQQFLLAGHDWGSIIGWWLVSHHPGRIKRYVSLSAGHPAVWRARMKTDPVQRKLSWYVQAFQLPMLPEMIMRAGNFRAPAEALQQTFRPGSVTDAELARYRTAWSQPGALTAMINYYRAIGRTTLQAPAAYRVRVPTLMLWAMHDRYGTVELARESIGLCDDGELVLLDNATHWSLVDEPGRVSRHLLQFFAG